VGVAYDDSVDTGFCQQISLKSIVKITLNVYY